MTYKYKANGEEITLNEYKEYIAVRFKELASHSTRASFVKRPEIGSFSERFEVPGEKYTIFPIAQNAQSRNICFKVLVTG